jgi:hypothetical protein
VSAMPGHGAGMPNRRTPGTMPHRGRNRYEVVTHLRPLTLSDLFVLSLGSAYLQGLHSSQNAASPRLRLLWMAPALQVRFDDLARWPGAVFRPVCAVSERLLALMESANRVPFCFAGYDAFDVRRVVPVPGLTGLAITSRRSPQPPEAEFLS